MDPKLVGDIYIERENVARDVESINIWNLALY